MAGGAVGDDLYVIPIETVRESIAVLQDRRIHPFFPAYLHLRQQAARQGSDSSIRPQWNELGRFLEVPGGPSNRPYYRPFWTLRREAGQEWLNKNLAGSYAPSSIRTVPRKVIEINRDQTFALRERHWELARTHLADDQPVPVLALAGFLFRNFSFRGDALPADEDLVIEFHKAFGFGPDDDDEFDHLYSSAWTGSDVDWFELWKAPAEEESTE